MGRIHIFVSSKGGVGKTVLLYCLYRILLEKEKKLAIFDLNPTNHDIYNILVNNSENIGPRNLGSKKIHSEDTMFYYVHDNEQWRMYRREYGYNLIGDATDFWYHVRRIKYHLPNDYHLLIDTNMHPLNLIHKGIGNRNDFKRNEIKESLKELNGNGQKIFIWFIWSKLSLELYANGYGELSTMAQDFRDDFRLLHVLNPSALIPEGDNQTKKSFIESIKQFFKHEDIKDVNEDEYNKLSFPFKPVFDSRVGKDFIDITKFQQYVMDADRFNSSNRGDSVGFYSSLNNIILDHHKNNIPQNVITMPYYYPDLHGYIDIIGLANGGSPQIEHLETLTNPLRNDLQRILESRMLNFFDIR